MTEAVLLILRVPDSDREKVAMMRVKGRVDIGTVQRDQDLDVKVAESAFFYAKRSSRSLVALLILNSDLFHWGFNDVILSGPAKTRFIGHIREELMKRSEETLSMLQEKADHHGVALEIRRIETRDPVSTALEEAQKGYEKIFMVKEPKRRFPIFAKTIEQQLRKETSIPIVTCP